jgi:hypothetical protein
MMGHPRVGLGRPSMATTRDGTDPSAMPQNGPRKVPEVLDSLPLRPVANPRWRMELLPGPVWARGLLPARFSET